MSVKAVIQTGFMVDVLFNIFVWMYVLDSGSRRTLAAIQEPKQQAQLASMMWYICIYLFSELVHTQ